MHDTYVEINHKNCIKTDNNVSNLEWSNRNLNLKHSYANKLRLPPWLGIKGKSNPNSKPVSKYDLDGNYICSYESATFASNKTGIERTSITSCVTEKLKTAGGYTWKYK